MILGITGAASTLCCGLIAVPAGVGALVVQDALLVFQVGMFTLAGS